MAKGSVYPTESVVRRDPRTGAEVRQITAHPSIHHHPFFYIPAYDDAMRALVFVSHRTGTPQIFIEDRATSRLIQLTDRPDLNEWSIHPSHDGNYIYFTAGSGAWRVRLETFEEERLAGLGNGPLIPEGMVGQAMGTTTLSHDDLWWAVPAKIGNSTRLYIIDTRNGRCEIVLEQDEIGHPEFHPRDAGLLRYMGPRPSHQWLWILSRDGKTHREVFRREEGSRRWIVHSVWNPLRREVLTIDWPHGMFGVDIDTGATRTVCSFNAWHAVVSRDGRGAVCDTTWPDNGLHLFDPQQPSSPALLCLSESSNLGNHWHQDHCPYDDGPVKVYAPQHTHPHPNFSPDAKYVVFTSDRTGTAQLYEVRVPERI